MLDNLEGHDGKEDLTDVWVDASVAPPVVHRITFFDVKPCPMFPESDYHLRGGAETICGIVVIPSTPRPSATGDHIGLLDDPPEVDCERCMTIEGWRDPTMAKALDPEVVRA